MIESHHIVKIIPIKNFLKIVRVRNLDQVTRTIIPLIEIGILSLFWQTREIAIITIIGLHH